MRGFEMAVDEDLRLVLAEARFAEPFAALVAVNREHLRRFDPWALELADVAAAREMLSAAAARFAAGTGVPTLVVTGGEIAGTWARGSTCRSGRALWGTGSARPTPGVG